METDEPMAAAPVALPKEKKGGKGAVIGMIFFMLVAIGLGVWVVILLLTPKDKNSTSDNSGDNNNGSSDHGSSEVATDDYYKSVSDIMALISEIDSSLGSHGSETEYSDGLRVEISDGLWSRTSLGFGSIATSLSSSNSADAIRNSVIAVLKKHNMTNTTIPSLWAGENDDATHYFKNSDGVYCYVSDADKFGNSNGVAYGCTSDALLSKQDKELNIALAEAYKKSDEGKQYGLSYIAGWTRYIKKNPAGTYETLTASFIDAAAIFYRKVGGEWQFLTGAQQGVSCDKYNTAELKEAFEGQTCWDSQGNDVVIKQ